MSLILLFSWRYQNRNIYFFYWNVPRFEQGCHPLSGKSLSDWCPIFLAYFLWNLYFHCRHVSSIILQNWYVSVIYLLHKLESTTHCTLEFSFLRFIEFLKKFSNFLFIYWKWFEIWSNKLQFIKYQWEVITNLPCSIAFTLLFVILIASSNVTKDV